MPNLGEFPIREKEDAVEVPKTPIKDEADSASLSSLGPSPETPSDSPRSARRALSLVKLDTSSPNELKHEPSRPKRTCTTTSKINYKVGSPASLIKKRN